MYQSIPAALPAEEEQRLAALSRYSIMDTPVDPLFDQLTTIGASLFHAPLCLITLIGKNRQFIKSSFGAEMREASRDDSFCGHLLLETETMVVLDATTDVRFARNPHVLGESHVRFYAGAPLLSSDGYKIGTFCIFDFVARTEFADSDRKSLSRFASLTSNLLEQRIVAMELAHSQEQLRVAAEHANEILESTLDSIVLFNHDWEITFQNENANRFTDARGDVLGRNLWRAFPEALGTPFERHLRRAARERVRIDFEDFYPGSNTWFKVSIHPATNGLVVFFRDVTAAHALQSATRLKEERYRLATPSLRDGIWDWEVQTGKAFFSASWQQILGLPAVEHFGDIAHWFDRFHPKDALRRDREGAILASGHDSDFEGEYRIAHADGTWHWMRSRGNIVRNQDGAIIRMTGSMSDITEYRCVDPLTGLHTRSCLLEHLEYRLDAESPRNKTFALIKIGMHHFKHINDSFGHREGDRILVEIARRLQETLAGNSIQDGFSPSGTNRIVAPADDFTSLSVVARMRGVVFAILLGGVRDVEDVVTYANLLQVILSAPVESEGQTLSVTARIGIVMCQRDYTSAERIVEDADVAMHQAKDAESETPIVFQADMRERTQRRLELESDLRSAVTEQQLLLHYQPKVILSTGQISGFEALVRWRHPTRGMISPAEFIPNAENNGLIVEIGQWTLEEAMRQLQSWTEAGIVTSSTNMAVNLSTRQFQDRTLLEAIRRVLEERSSVAANLTLEVTESALIGNMELAKQKLDALRGLGVRLDLDDFGTGYSSLHYLHRLPFHSLKIDQSFVRSLEESEESLAIARSIIQLGASLNMCVIAEGVETAQQRDRLIGLGCRYGQGYFFSKPLPAAQMEKLLRDRQNS